jgi:hypothetical protein
MDARNSVTLARYGLGRGLSGGHGGGAGVTVGEIAPPLPSHMVFYTARPEGHQISGIKQELKEVVSTVRSIKLKLPQGIWLHLTYALVRIAYGDRLGTQGTDPARRGDIGEDVGDKRSPATRKFRKSAKNDDTTEIPDSRGVWGQEVPCGMPANQSPPTDRRIMYGSTTTNS